MATFGQGINAQLGAIDYSPIQRGSAVGAQLAAQGGQMIGQGLANLGEEVGKGVAAYYKKQEIKKLEDDGVAFIQNLGTKNPYILQAVGIKDPNDTKAIKAGMKAVGGVENFFKMANVAKGEMDKSQAADILMRYGASGGASSYMGANGETLGSPEANMMAQNQYMAQTTQRLQQDKLRAEAILDRANAGAKFPVGKIMSEAEFKALDTKKYDVKAELLPDGRYLVKSISPFGPGSQNVINMGGSALERVVGEGLGQDMLGEYRAAKNAPDALAKLNEVQGLIKSGNITTGIGAEIIQNANRLRAQFLKDIEAGKTVSNTQLLDSLLGSDVFPMIDALGIGARGMDTPPEREFLRESFTGTKAFTPETLSRLTEIRENMHRRAINKFQKNNASNSYKVLFDMGAVMPDFSSIPPIKGLNGEPLDIPYQTWQNMPEERRKLFRK